MTGKNAILFGELVVKNNLASQEEVDHCLKLQKRLITQGKMPKRLAALLVDQSILKAREANALLRAQRRLARDRKEGKDTIRISGYEISEKLGEGGIGNVYKARQVSMQRVVALKVLHDRWVDDDEFKKRFLLEARLVGKLSHQNIIQVYDVGKENGRYYFSMEFINGQTLEEILETTGPIEPSLCLDYILQITRALKHIQQFNIVHRDIKPGNIMLTSSGLAKLGDFGFVKSAIDDTLSREGLVLGTPDYISPEQAIGDKDVDFRSDIYSLGASLYHMVTGDTPYHGTVSSVMRQHVKGDLQAGVDVAQTQEIDDDFWMVIEKMMARDSDDRYQTYNALFKDLERLKVGQAPSTKRLEAGKTTVMRAFNTEKTLLQSVQKENRVLKKRLQRFQIMLGLFAASAAVAAIMLFIMLLSNA